MSTTLSVQQAGRTKRLVAQTPYELREVMAALPGSVWDRSQRVWTYPATIGCAAVVSNALRQKASRSLTLGTEVHELLAWAQRAVDARSHRTAEDLSNPDSKTDAWLHQRRAFHWALEQEAALLEMDMGTGKSKVAVDLSNAWAADLGLIIAPKNVLGGWRKQFAVHSASDAYFVTPGRVYKRDGRFKLTATPAERIAALERDMRANDALMVTINYELAWREPIRSWILAQRWRVVVLDEGHRAKAPGGKQGLFAAALRDAALGIDGCRRLELTGTSMPHSPLDLYGQGRFLEPSLFGTSYQAFKVRYGKPRVKYFETDVDAEGELVQRPVYLTDAGGRVIVDGVRDEVRGELADKLASIAFHVSADEALDLPDQLDDTIIVELSAKTSKAYRDLDNHLIAEIVDGVCTVDNALTRFLRLAQITSGHLPVEVGCGWCGGEGFVGDPQLACSHCAGTGVTERIETIGSEKRDALAERLVDLPAGRIDPRTFEVTRREPVVCFGRFTHDLMSIEQACDKAGRGPYRELSGHRGDALTEDSTLVPDTGVAGVQIQSGSEGVDFTLARLAVYYSLGFSLYQYKQSRARTRRPGADLSHPVEYTHLVAVLDDGTPTIDQGVYDALDMREEVVQYVYRQMQSRAGVAVAA